MHVHADAQCLLHHVCLLCYSVLAITSLFNVRLQQLGNIWTPGHKPKCSRGSKLSDNFYMAQRVPRAWSVIHAREVIVSPWCFYCSSRRPDCRGRDAYWLVSCPSWGCGYTMARASSIFSSVTRCGLGMGITFECRWLSLGTHGVALVSLSYVFTTSLKIIVIICWIWYPNLNIRKTESLRSAVP